jgi:type II secretory pathway component PulM
MAMGGMLDRMKEQEWFQQLNAAWGQLPPEQQQMARIGGTVAGFLISAYLMFTTYDSAHTAKEEYYQKEELTRILTQANDELRRLKGQNTGIPQGSAQTWSSVFQGLATLQGLPATAVEILKESPGATQGVIQESLLEVKIKGLQVRQLVPMLYQIEHGSPPMKLKGLIVEPSTEEGVLNAKVNVSGYMAKPEKGDKAK